MAAEKLKNIFLSASIPLAERNPRYIESADVIAIRDAVIALTTSVISQHRLIWGGHPSITPLINYVVQKHKLSVQDHVLLYQTKFFEKFFPEDNLRFKNVIQTPSLNTRSASLEVMRKKMIGDNEFSAAVFIGGMEGIEEEFKMFKEFHPMAIILPLASTGAATKMLFEKLNFENDRLINDYAYSSIFQEFLIDKI